LDASLVTSAGLDKLNGELRLLRSKRATLVEGIRAELDGIADRGASGEYLDARDGLARLEQQIASLEARLTSATVVQPNPADGELGIGESVRLRDLDSGELADYRIVGTGETDPAAGSISYLSPVGSALIGRRAGDVIVVKTPKGLLRVELLEIGL
jgi:transcription elongation factor GreA